MQKKNNMQIQMELCKLCAMHFEDGQGQHD